MKFFIALLMTLTTFSTFASNVTVCSEDSVTVIVKGFSQGDCIQNVKRMILKLEAKDKIILDVQSICPKYQNSAYFWYGEVTYLKY